MESINPCIHTNLFIFKEEQIIGKILDHVTKKFMPQGILKYYIRLKQQINNILVKKYKGTWVITFGGRNYEGNYYILQLHNHAH